MARSADNLGNTDQIGQTPPGFSSFILLSPDGKFVLARIPPHEGGSWARLSDTSDKAWIPLVGSDEAQYDFSFWVSNLSPHQVS